MTKALISWIKAKFRESNQGFSIKWNPKSIKLWCLEKILNHHLILKGKIKFSSACWNQNVRQIFSNYISRRLKLTTNGLKNFPWQQKCFTWILYFWQKTERKEAKDNSLTKINSLMRCKKSNDTTLVCLIVQTGWTNQSLFFHQKLWKPDDLSLTQLIARKILKNMTTILLSCLIFIRWLKMS